MFSRPIAFFAFLALACALPSPLALHASALTWDRTEARIELDPGQEEARAIYRVTNEGDEAVRIARIKTSCGCTGSVVDKKIIRPGETTEIVGTFHKGKRQGTNRNKLEVYLDSQPQPVATLHMIVTVPTLIDAQPQIVYWNSNTPQTAREVRVTLDKRYVDAIVDVEYNRDAFTITEEKDPKGKADRVLRILPKSFDSSIRDTIQIRASGADGAEADTRIHVFVQP